MTQSDAELLRRVIDLLNTGDDTGCDGLVVVNLQEFLTVRELVQEMTGQLCGSIRSDS
jgi:hypothetical protein